MLQSFVEIPILTISVLWRGTLFLMKIVAAKVFAPPGGVFLMGAVKAVRGEEGSAGRGRPFTGGETTSMENN